MASKQGAPTKARNGAKPPMPEMGIVRAPLDKPQAIAELTHLEVSEIKERRRLIDAKVAEVNDMSKVVALLRNEQTKYAQSLLTQRGFSLNDDYNVDSEAGVIFLTATYVEPDVQVEDTEVIATPEPGE